MDIEQALKILNRVCASVQADLQTHNQIQQALQVVANALKGQVVAKQPKSKKTK